MQVVPDRERGLVVTTLDERTVLGRAGLFLAVTFALALAVYLPIIASARGWIGVAVPPGLAALGVVTPAVAALLLHLRDGGVAGARRALGSATAWRFGRRWWLVTLLLAPVLLGLMYAAYLLLGGGYQPSPMLATFGSPQALLVLPVLVLVTLLLALAEELGWRGYLLPVLQTRYGAAVSSLVLGACWFAWHVPLQFVPGNANAGFPLALWGVSIVATAFVYTWLFNNTGGSVLAVTVFHGLLNVVGPFIALHPSVTGNPLSAYVMVGVNVLFALAILGVYGTASFTRRRTAVAADASLDD